MCNLQTGVRRVPAGGQLVSLLAALLQQDVLLHGRLRRGARRVPDHEAELGAGVHALPRKGQTKEARHHGHPESRVWSRGHRKVRRKTQVFMLKLKQIHSGGLARGLMFKSECLDHQITPAPSRC